MDDNTKTNCVTGSGTGVTFTSGYIQPTGYLFSFNKQVACAPFPTLAVEKEIKSGLALAKEKNSLLETVVQYPYKVDDKMTLSTGWKVYIDGETAKGQVWARKIYKIGPMPQVGQEDKRIPFILIPESCILMIDSNGTYPYGPVYIGSPQYAYSTGVIPLTIDNVDNYNVTGPLTNK